MKCVERGVSIQWSEAPHGESTRSSLNRRSSTLFRTPVSRGVRTHWNRIEAIETKVLVPQVELFWPKTAKKVPISSIYLDFKCHRMCFTIESKQATFDSKGIFGNLIRDWIKSLWTSFHDVPGRFPVQIVERETWRKAIRNFKELVCNRKHSLGAWFSPYLSSPLE